MTASFMITFRETLEAALVVGIVWSYLVKTGNRQLLGTVLNGIIAGISASVLGAVLFDFLAGGFSGRAEEIFEGITMIIGGGLLTSMIFWMMKNNAAQELLGSVARAVAGTSSMALFLLVFFAILREGIETVIFLSSAEMMNGGNSIPGAVLGIIIAIWVGWAFFRGAMRLNIKTVFNLSSVLLIMFAAGLFAHGIHELQEAAVIPVIVEHVWDINPALAANGSYPVLHEKGLVGAIFKGLFGYNGNPTLLEIITYLLYLGFTVSSWLTISSRQRLVLEEAKD